jgi:hypothetical protein
MAAARALADAATALTNQAMLSINSTSLVRGLARALFPVVYRAQNSDIRSYEMNTAQHA